MKIKMAITLLLGILLIPGIACKSNTTLIAKWSMNEESGNTIHDSAGDNDGVISGATWTTGRIGSGLSFDGFNDYVACEHNTIDMSYSSFTVEAWSKRTGTDNEASTIVSTGGSGWTQGFLLQHRNNGLWAEVSDGVNDGVYIRAMGIGLYDNNWHQLTLVVDRQNNTAYGYADSRKVVGPIDISSEGDLYRDGTNIMIGREGIYSVSSQHYAGSIDEVTIYNYALSEEEVLRHYNSAPTFTPTRTPQCPTNTPEPVPSVEPVTSPTNQLMQTIRVHNIGRTSVTITCESGTFTATGFDANTGASLINVTLLPDTIHHLQIEAHVSSWDIGDCHYVGYNFSVPPWDQSGNTFIIVQQTSPITPTP